MQTELGLFYDPIKGEYFLHVEGIKLPGVASSPVQQTIWTLPFEDSLEALLRGETCVFADCICAEDTFTKNTLALKEEERNYLGQKQSKIRQLQLIKVSFVFVHYLSFLFF